MPEPAHDLGGARGLAAPATQIEIAPVRMSGAG